MTDAVLVTGASTGIGKAIVEDLRERGVHVFAAVRDLSTVEDHPNVTAVRLDVTSADEIAAAAKTVADALGDDRLRGIVNNAGISSGGPLEFLDIDELRNVLEVNVVAQVAVTQAFLPLLRDRGVSDPRIVFMGSIASKVAAPFLGPYAASKHALLAIGESMRHELRRWGFRVVVVEPGNISTPIWNKGLDLADRTEEAMPPRAHELYGDIVDGMRNVIKDADASGIPPSAVANVVHKALFDKHPRPEYLVGLDARAMWAGSKLPSPIFDRVVALETKRRMGR